MYDPRIALVAEGSTDFVVIEAALKAVLQRPFVLNQLQPESTRPEMGGGWGGVFKWCQEFSQRRLANIASDPTLSQFDLVIVHLDADVAEKKYADYGDAVMQAALTLQPLPCAHPCPPPSNTVVALESVLLSWLGIPAIGPKSLFCIPSKATEAWLLAAVLPVDHALLTELECNLDIETRLAQLPKGQRIRKNVHEYRNRAGAVTSQWAQVKARCNQAALFDQEVRAITQAFPG